MIEREDRGATSILTLARGRANALDLELVSALSAELSTLEDLDACRAVVLTGTGSIFSAGVDLFRVVDEGPEYLDRFLPALEEALLDLFTFPYPVVAAVNGHAIAGGCVLSMATDYRVMAEGEGTIGVPELRVGVPFPAVAIEIVRSAVRRDQLQRVVYRGETFGSRDALDRGLIDEVVDPPTLVDRACEIATEVGRIPCDAFQITKRQLRESSIERIERMRRSTGADVEAAWKSPHTIAAIREYLEKTLGKRS